MTVVAVALTVVAVEQDRHGLFWCDGCLIYFCDRYREGTVNGVALWCEFHFGDGHTISTGPRQPPVIGQRVEWDYYSRQAVHLCHSPRAVSTHCTLHFHVHFKPNEGSISFTWDF